MWDWYRWHYFSIPLLIIFYSLDISFCSESVSRILLPPHQRNTHRRPAPPSSDTAEGKGYYHIFDGISSGLELAVDECKQQFHWDIWNCPVTPGNIISKSQNKGTREVSFLQAISSAGIMHSVTKTCSRQGNNLCGCGSGGEKDSFSSDTLNWQWGGCSHNVKFGEKVSKLFLKTDSSSEHINQIIKAHNERAGHRAVKRTMRTLCKCHGVTGSCSMRTCWKKLEEFNVVGTLLKKKYKRSKDIRNTHRFIQSSNKVRHPRVTRISKHDLIYFEDSPNYCETDNSIGYLGTLGRECLKIEKGANRSSVSKFLRHSCKRLCKNCGHRVGKLVFEESYKCDCEFKWCCAVDCKMCTRKMTKYFCK